MRQQSSISIGLHSEPFIDRSPSNCQAGQVRSILKTFLKDINFVPTGLNSVNKVLEDHMRSLLYNRGLECKQLEQIIHLSASLVELGYHNCTLDEKKNLALFNWFIIYINDSVQKNLLPFREFGSRLLRHQPQLDPVLTALTEVLDHTWDFYDPTVASIILNKTKTLDFVTASCIEPGLENIPLKHEINRSPWYIRDMSGLSVGYSLFSFVKRRNFDVMQVVQALPDMNVWVSPRQRVKILKKSQQIVLFHFYFHK